MFYQIIDSTDRPTEIAESDVFVCESTYDELKKQIRRNHPGTALRKFKHSQLVTQDEIYHFKRPIAPAKVTQSYSFKINFTKLYSLTEGLYQGLLLRKTRFKYFCTIQVEIVQEEWNFVLESWKVYTKTYRR